MGNRGNSSSKLICPKCGSDRIKVELRSLGTTSKTNYYRTGFKKSRIAPSGKRTYKSQRSYKSIAICQNCGFYWTVSSDANATIAAAIWFILIIFAMFLCFRSCSYDGKLDNKTAEQSQGASIWATEYTPLDQFEFSLEGNFITVEEYIGEESKIWIAPSYEIGGVSFDVLKVNGPISYKKVESIILSDGICEIAHNIFNFGSDIKYIYMPRHCLKNTKGQSK